MDKSSRIRTFVKGLDELLSGGIIKGTSTLVIGPSGSGKTLLTLSTAAENALRGRRVLYISLDEPVSQLNETLVLLGYNPFKLHASGLRIVYVDPYTVTPGRLRYLLKELAIESGLGKDLVIIDGLSSLYRILGDVEFERVVEELILLFKNENIPVIMSMARDYFRDGGLLDTIVDNVIVLRINLKDDMVTRELMVLKSRMNLTDNKWHRMILKDGKLQVV